MLFFDAGGRGIAGNGLQGFLVLLTLVFFTSAAFGIEGGDPSAGVSSLQQEPVSYYRVVVEGRASRRPALEVKKGVVLLPFAEISEALGGEYRLDRNENAFYYRRLQDGARFRVDLNTGATTVNGKSLGFLPDFKYIDTDQMMFPVNTAMVLTGVHADLQVPKKRVVLKLDDRLRAVSGFQVYVNGRRLPVLEPEPRAVGSVLLLPLRPVMKQLGDHLEVDQAASTITVTRVQDSSRIALNLLTGLVKVNGHVAGVTPNIGYADVDLLLLPSSAIETLTGTHINIIPGSDLIHIDLDDRLRGRVLPSQAVIDEARTTPLTLETVDFLTGNRVINYLETRQRFREFNSRFRYETPEFPGKTGDIDPSWLALEYDSMMGYGGSIGDYNASRSELSGVDVSRFRGLSHYQPADNGTYVATLGAPLSGSKSRGDYSVPEFDGLAAGLRYYDNGKTWEAGLGYRESSSGRKRAVASHLWDWQSSPEKYGDLSFHEDLDIGAFDGNEGREADARGGLFLNYRPVSRLGLNAEARYSGKQFNQFDDLPPDGELVITERPATDILTTSFGASYRLFDSTSVAVRTHWQKRGIVETWDGSTVTNTLSLSSQPIQNGPWFTVDYSETTETLPEADSVDSSRLSLRATQQFKHGRLTITHRVSKRDDKDNARVSTFVATANPWVKQLPKYASVSLAPNLVGGESDDNSWLRLGLTGDFQSGRLLGQKLDLSANAGHLEPLNPVDLGIDNTQSDGPGDSSVIKESATNYASVTSRYRFNRNVQLEAQYTSDFEDSDLFTLALRGHLSVNRPRRYRLPLPGRGILKGQIFMDLDNNNVKDEGEPGFSNAKVGLRGTPYWLKTDADGYFTIQNLPQGSYSPMLDRKLLPINLMIKDDERPMTTIAEGQITEVSLPVIRSGQIRGRVYEDSNADGIGEPNEPGIDGVKLTLMPGEFSTFTTLFGQYAFEMIPPGEYTLAVDPAFVQEGRQAPPPVTVTIQAPDSMMQEVDMGLTVLH